MANCRFAENGAKSIQKLQKIGKNAIFPMESELKFIDKRMENGYNKKQLEHHRDLKSGCGGIFAFNQALRNGNA